MFNFYAGRGSSTFEGNYRVYPVSFIDKIDAENGDKIFLPPSALDRLGTSDSSKGFIFARLPKGLSLTVAVFLFAACKCRLEARCTITNGSGTVSKQDA